MNYLDNVKKISVLYKKTKQKKLVVNLHLGKQPKIHVKIQNMKMKVEETSHVLITSSHVPNKILEVCNILEDLTDKNLHKPYNTRKKTKLFIFKITTFIYY